MDIEISWRAPIKPSESLAGIPLGVHVRDLERAFAEYASDCTEGEYVFLGSPALRMEKGFDSNGDGGYGFFIVDPELTNWRLYYDRPDHLGVESRALHVLTRNWRVYAIKAWMYESLAKGDKPVNSYQGLLPEGLGLGDLIRDLLPYTELEFDEAEQWFYTGEEYGGLEVSGFCRDLDEDPDQIITALAVIGS